MSSREIFLIIGLILIVVYFAVERFSKLPEAVSWVLLAAAVICLLLGLAKSCGLG